MCHPQKPWWRTWYSTIPNNFLWSSFPKNVHKIISSCFINYLWKLFCITLHFIRLLLCFIFTFSKHRCRRVVFLVPTQWLAAFILYTSKYLLSIYLGTDFNMKFPHFTWKSHPWLQVAVLTQGSVMVHPSACFWNPSPF